MAATDQRPRTIAGVPPLRRGKGKETTFAGALEAALAVTAHPYDYATLMGVTGLAFRTRWFQGPDTRWCASNPVGEFPEEIEAARRATGWDLDCECRLGEAEPHMEGLVPEIVASIDAGRPVLAYDPSLHLGVIYGYEEGGQTVLMHDYSRQETPSRRRVSELGAMALFLGEHSQPMPRRDAVIQGLRMASQNWRRRHDPPNEERGYWLGEMALTRWSEDLSLSSTLSEKKREKLFFVSWWNLDCMADARRAAVVFLEEHLNLFLGTRQEALRRAMKHYEQEAGILTAVFAHRDAFLGPWSGKSLSDWTPGVRRREQEILGEARALEASAIASIEEALAGLVVS